MITQHLVYSQAFFVQGMNASAWASPIYLRESYAFEWYPLSSCGLRRRQLRRVAIGILALNLTGGIAARAKGLSPEKRSFSANRAAQPQLVFDRMRAILTPKQL